MAAAPQDCSHLCRFSLTVIQNSKSWLIACFVLAVAALSAQEYSFRTYGMMEGLTNLSVQKIFQDRTGFLWVGTENGIFRFDGEHFEPFGPEHGLPHNSGIMFGETPNGDMLVGGVFGLYQLRGNHFEKLAVPFSRVSWVQGIQSDGKGHTYLGTEAGLMELTQQPGEAGVTVQKLTRARGPSGPGAEGILLDGQTIWYGCGVELCRRSPDGLQNYGTESGLPRARVMALRKDRKGTLWVQSDDAGLFALDAGQSHFYAPNLPLASPLLHGTPALDADGNLLVPTSAGLLVHDTNGWRKIDRSVGLRGGVSSAFEDRRHSIWIALEGRGLAHWRGYREWESYSAASGLNNDLIFEILRQPDGTLWVATGGGLFRGRSEHGSWTFHSIPSLLGLSVHSLQMDSAGELWIGTGARGLAHFSPRSGSVKWFGPSQGLTGMAAAVIRFDRQKRLWIGTEQGLFVANPPYKSISRVTEVPARRIWAIAEGSDGTLWAGGIGGLYQNSSGQWKTITRADGLSNQEILSLGAGQNGDIWVGYRFGGSIDRVHAVSGGVSIENNVQRPGSDGIVYFMNFDTKGRLWIGTDRGVDMLDGSWWKHYDTTDGLAWNDCDLNAFEEDPDGSVWIGTGGGLSHFKPLAQEDSTVPIRVILTGLMVGKTDVSDQSNPAFNIHANSLTARYTALNTDPESSISFRYRLSGASDSWVVTTQRELQFANLAPGAYRLQIEALDDREGVWSDQKAEFPFSVLAPWYATLWFIAICVLVPFMAILGIVRLRINASRRRERELVEIVEEKTADLRLANEELLRLSLTDPLTGLANRRVFNQTLEKEFARLRRSGAPISLIMLDVDHFKALNDSEGHQRGDDYLVALGAALHGAARRQIDVAARCGGEEFALILPATDAADALRIAEEVRIRVMRLNLPHRASPVAPFLTVSAGVATGTMNGWNTPESLVAAADQALYRAKGTGRNRVEAAPSSPAPSSPADEAKQ